MKRRVSTATTLLALGFSSLAWIPTARAEEGPPAAEMSDPAGPGDDDASTAPPPAPKAQRPRSKDEFVFSELPAGAKAASTVGLIGLTLATIALATFEDPEPAMIVLGGVSSGIAVLGFGIAGIIVLTDDDETPATSDVPTATGVVVGVSRAF